MLNENIISSEITWSKEDFRDERSERSPLSQQRLLIFWNQDLELELLLQD